MTKEELCMRVYESNDIMSKAAARRVVELIIDTITEEVSNGKEVQVSGLGKFYPIKLKAASGVSPLGGAWSRPEKTVPKFKPAVKFKKSVA